MKHTIRIFLIISICFQAFNLKAQDTIVIEKSKVIAKGQNFDVPAGTVVILKPGAKIWVEGGLNLNGTNTNPIVVISEDAKDPGSGIVINGQSYQQSIQVKYTKFISLTQAIRFDPFWARKSILLDHVQTSQSIYNESSIYVSAPFIDYNFPPIQFTISELDYFNNNASFFVEEFGNRNIHFNFNHLNFYENALAPSEEKTGIFHLQVTEENQKHRNQIDNISFHRNTQGKHEIGLFVTGNQDTVYVQSASSIQSSIPVVDSKSDPRLPTVQINKTENIENILVDKCLIKSIDHQNGKIVIHSNASCSASILKDSANQTVPFTVTRNKDSINISYTGNSIPTRIWMNYQFWIQVPSILHSIDTNQKASPEKKDTKIEEVRKHGFWADSSMLKDLNIFNKTFEIGMFTGVAAYIGDIKPKFGLPACYEWSNGIYLQYHHNKHLSYQFTYNRADLGSDDPSSLYLAYSSLPIYIDKGTYSWNLPSYRMNFKTKIYAVELGTTYYFNRYDKNDHSVKNLKGKWVSGIGAGLGVFRFDPYRYAIYSKNPDEVQWVSLREMGTEGQNFLPGKTQYGKFAVNFNLHYELNFCYERWKFKTELRGVITSTNYLDDMGEGFYYGNDYEKWAASAPKWANYVDQNGNSVPMVQVFPDYGKVGSRRSYSMLPDGYVQFHFGISYDIGNPIPANSKFQKFFNKIFK